MSKRRETDGGCNGMMGRRDSVVSGWVRITG